MQSKQYGHKLKSHLYSMHLPFSGIAVVQILYYNTTIVEILWSYMSITIV